MIYTGIGSRATPAPVLDTMRRIARYLAGRGWTLRSGGASGADLAFEGACIDTPSSSRLIYRPNGRVFANGAYVSTIPLHQQVAAIEIAERLHPCWSNVPLTKRPPLARNPFQVTGAALDIPSNFVVYWAIERDSEPQGGTRIAVMYARELGVPTFNLLFGTEPLKVYLKEIGIL